MTLRRWIRAAGFFFACSTFPAAAFAQSSSAEWPGLERSALQTVYVRDQSGVETSGKLLRLSPDAVVLLVEGSERPFAMADVSRIQKRGDSLRNGALIGGALGLGLGILTGGISDCPGANASGPCPAFRAALVPVAALTYAALGAGVDALVQGRTTIYAAPTDRSARMPVGTGRTSLLRIGVSW